MKVSTRHKKNKGSGNGCLRREYNNQFFSDEVRVAMGGMMNKPIMKKNGCIRGLPVLIALVAIAALGLLVVPDAHAQYTITSCADCHAYPPVDGTARNNPEGAVVGSHGKHSSATEYAYPCTVCHVNNTTFNHRNAMIEMVSPMNNHSGSYNKGNSFPQTNTPTLSTCSNTYCHSKGTGGTLHTGDNRAVATNTSPTWGTAGPLACNSCHGNETGNDGTGRPFYTSGSPKPNSHVSSVKHKSLSCDKCHYPTTTTGNTITDKRKHADRQYNVAGTGTAPYTFSYTYNVSGGTCSTAYCHSNVQSSPPGGAVTYRTPAWGGTVTCSAASCHGGNVDPGKIASGSHTGHVATSKYNYSCSICHSGAGTGTPKHADYAVDVAFSGTVATGTTYSGTPVPGDPYGTCSTSYCHSSGERINVSPAIEYRTPSWGGPAITTCTVCHQGPATLATMQGRTGADRMSPAHNIHIATDRYGSNTNYTCNTCHANVASNNTTISSYTLHVNKAKDVAINTTTWGGGSWASPNCTNLYCHSQGTANASPFPAPNVAAAWNTTFAEPCRSCHNAAQSVTPADATDRMNTNRHLAHIDNASAVGKRIACGECHAATLTGDTNIAGVTGGYARHVNRLINVKFDNVINLNTDNPTYAGLSTTGTDGATKAPGSAVGSCSNVYCHSTGNLGTGSNLTFRTIAWNAAAIGCNGCHGDPAGTAAHPVYANAGAGHVNANSHPAHVARSGISCDVCHIETTQSTAIPPTAVRTDLSPSRHINRVENVTFNTARAGANASWSAATKTCSTTYCHGSAGIQWGATLANSCDSCHAGQGAGTATTKRYTGPHYDATNSPDGHTFTAKYSLACENCHTQLHSGGAASRIVHAGGDVNTATPQTAEVKFTDQTGTIQYGGGGATFRYRSLFASPYGLGALTPTYTATTTSAGSDPVNSQITWTAGTCSTIWCHSNANPRLRSGETGSLNAYRTPTWSGSLTCTGCHRGPEAVATMTSATDRLSTSHAKHIATDRYGQSANYTCNTCHSATVTTATNTAIGNFANHVDGTKQVVMNTWAGGTWTAPSCSSVYCHSTGERLGVTPTIEYRTISWADAAITTCTACHQGPDTAATMAGRTGADRMSPAHIKHIASDRYGVSTTTGRAAADQITCNFCHVNVASNNTTISSYTLHVNKEKNVAFNTWADPAGPNAGGWTSPNCTNTYCHSRGTSVATGVDPSHAAVSWTATISCNSCHGTEAGTTGAPAYADLKKEARPVDVTKAAPATASGTGWTNPGEALTSNNIYATFNTTTQADLSVRGFGITTSELPDNFTITGISVTIEGHGVSSLGTQRQIRVGLTKDGSTLVGTRKTAILLPFGAIGADEHKGLGGPGDLWGATFTPAEIRAGTFGVLIGDNDTTAAELRIDHVRITVHARPAATNWAGGANVYYSDDRYAVFNNTTQNRLPILNFGYTISEVPDTTAIRGITVVIEGNGSGAAGNRDLFVALTKDGVTPIGEKASPDLPTSDGIIMLGGYGDLWGTTWTPAEIRSMTFGVLIRDQDTSAAALNIDQVLIIVHTDASPKMNSHSIHMAKTGYTCSTCHNNTVSTGNSPITGYAQHVNKSYNVSGTNFTSYTYSASGGTCGSVAAGCHGGTAGGFATAKWGVTEIDCISCHRVGQDAGDGGPTRRAIVGEFYNTWSHKRSAGGIVTKYDCGVCHMEGDPQTGMITAFHKDNKLDFRDPDTGVTIKGVTFSDATNSYTSTGTDATAAVFARNTGSNSLEPFAVAVQINLCLKCHDADGAASTLARVPGGTALRPFNTAPSHTPGNNVLNVKAHFEPSNASYHPVMGKGNNPRVNSLTMETPWNMTKTVAGFPARPTGTGEAQAVTPTWATPGNITASDNAYATYDGTNQANLIARNFGFTTTEMPDGANIWGIGVAIEGHALSGTAANRQIRVALTKDGSTPATSWRTIELRQTTDRIENIGGRGDNWGATWTPAEIRSASFGVLISDNDTTNDGGVNPDFRIDHVRVVIYRDQAKGYLITCWDCHDSSAAARTIGGSVPSVTAHGGTVTVRRPIAYSAALGNTSTQAADAGLCDLCHATALYVGTTNSAESGFGGVDMGLKHEDESAMHYHEDNDWVCNTCHGSSWLDPGRPRRAEDAHGYNTMVDGSPTWGIDPTSGYLRGARPYAFLRNNDDKGTAAGGARWDNWRPRYEGATTHALDTWGCSWTTAVNGTPAAPCGREDHATAGPAAGTDDDHYAPYAPGGWY